jgi:cyclic beta-1,2-glucan synthetase
MGLALLTSLSACDFGCLSAGRLVDRTARAFKAMASMERHRGHFCNSYDIQSLDPRHIYSVDSGNLAGPVLK